MDYCIRTFASSSLPNGEQRKWRGCASPAKPHFVKAVPNSSTTAEGTVLGNATSIFRPKKIQVFLACSVQFAFIVIRNIGKIGEERYSL